MASLEVFTNDASTTTTSTYGTTAPASGTVETWVMSSSAGFPAASSTGVGTSFKIADPSLVAEKILVTNISGTTWTVTRGADGTTPVAHGTGATFRLTATSSTFAKILDWIIATSPIFGADPTGTNVSDTAVTAALNAAVPGQQVYLPAGTFLNASPWIIPEGVMLMGCTPVPPAIGYNAPDEYGTIISATSGWTRGSIVPATNNPGAVYVNGDNTTVHRIGLANVWVDISDAPSGTHGVSLWGGVFHANLRDIGVLGAASAANSTGTGNNIVVAQDTHGNRFDGGGFINIMSQNAEGYGLFWHGQDSEVINLHCQGYQASTGGLAGIYIDNGNNTRWINCRSDQSGDSGFVLDSNPGGSPNTPGSTISLIGCGTENNYNYGCKIINSSGSGSNQPRTPINIVNCSFDYDGRQGSVNPTSGAGIYVQGVNVVNISNTNVTTGGNQGTGNLHYYPEYALVTATPGVPQRISWRGGVVNSNSGPVLDGASANPIVEVGSVVGSAWINTSTVASYTLNLPGGGGGVSTVTAGDTSIVIGGTSSNPTVETATLDVIATDHPPAAAWSNNSKKITSLANGSASSDAAAFGQIPTSAASIGGVTSVTAGDTSIVVGGTASAPTVETGTLDVIATDHPPAANWSNNTHKITNIGNGTNPQDAAAFGQLPSLPLSRANGGTGVSTTPMTPQTFTPANPTATASTSLVMMGLGSACSFTPASSGNVHVTVTGVTLTNTAAAILTLGGRYGTGTAPANGAAASGTRFGAAADFSIRAATFTAGVPFALSAVLALTAGTTYWIDIALDTATGADTAAVNSVGVTAIELS